MGKNSAPGKCSGDSSIQLRVKAIVESPAYGLAASADLSTSGKSKPEEFFKKSLVSFGKSLTFIQTIGLIGCFVNIEHGKEWISLGVGKFIGEH